jgi:ATP-dependent helicase/nuclease subunit B
MDKILYFQQLFSNERSELIDKCIELQRTGRNFLYILPSREAIRSVRYAILDRNKGMLNSRVIMFDELEREVAQQYIDRSNVIYEDVERIIISDICRDPSLKLDYFRKVSNKRGFQDEVRAFIKYMKRSCMDTEKLKSIIGKIEDEILADKLGDILLLYNSYEDRLRKRGLYDISDISLIAAEKIGDSKFLESIDTIVIDGFINIDPVNIQLIRNLVYSDKVNLYINCPYKNSLTEEFITWEIKDKFKDMNFHTVEQASETVKTKESTRELAVKFYSGEKLTGKTQGIWIKEYPCIASEVRETAREIKALLLKGKYPEEIALFINNREEYAPQLIRTCLEFNIPIALKQEIPLSEAALVRKALEALENQKSELIFPEELLEEYNRLLLEAAGDTAPLVETALEGSLSVEEILQLKTVDSCSKLLSNLKWNLKLCGMYDRKMEKGEFLQLLREHLQNTMITLQGADNAGIKVLNTDLAKGVYYDHVYVLGLNEGEIPKAVKNEGLFDELEAEILHKKGIGYRDSRWELEREKIRFNLTLAAAKESLALSYRSSDEDGKFSIQSSLLEQVRFITGIQKINKFTMRDRFDLKYQALMSSGELRAAVLKQFFEKRYMGFEDKTFEEKLAFIKGYEVNIKELVAAALAEHHRNGEDFFNRYEGIIEEEFEKLGFSPSRLSFYEIDEYSKCPFKYMVENIFNLKPQEEEEAEVFSKIEIGRLYKDVLGSYYDDLQNFNEIHQQKFDKIFCDLVDRIKKQEDREEEREQMAAVFKENLYNFINADLKRLKKYQSTAKRVIKPFVNKIILENEEIFGVPLKCTIDRIDLEYESVKGELIPTGRYIVYVYKKNNRPESSELISLEHSQLVLCHHIAEDYLKKFFKGKEPDCMALLYLSVEKSKSSVNKTGFYRTEYKAPLGFTGNSKFDMNREWFYSYMSFMKDVYAEVISKLAGGRYPYRLCCKIYDSDYSQCKYRGVCRFSKNKMEVMVGE